MEAPVRILIVEDSASLRRIYQHVLSQAGHVVLEAETGAAALELVRTESPDILLLDRVLPDMDGSHICARVKSDPDAAETYVIMLSGLKTTEDDRVSGLEAGADDYIVKPVGKRELLARVQVAVRLRAAKLRLHASEMQFRTLAENSPDYIARIDRNGGISYLNPAARDFFEQDPAQPVESVGLIHHLIEADELWTQVQQVFATGQSSRMKSLVRGGGQVRHLDTRLVPEFDPHGAVQSILAVARDYTDFVVAEQEARRLAAVVQQSVDAVQITDAQGKIIYVNAAYDKLTGLAAEAVLGRELPGFAYTCPDHAECRLLDHLQAEEDRWHGLISALPADGETQELDTTIFAIRNDSGKVTNYAALQRDVTERRRTEQEREVVIRVAAALRAAITRQEVLEATLDQVLLFSPVAGAIYTALDQAGAGENVAGFGQSQLESQVGNPATDETHAAQVPESGGMLHPTVNVECMRPPLLAQHEDADYTDADYAEADFGEACAIDPDVLRHVLVKRTVVVEASAWSGLLGFDGQWPKAVRWIVGLAIPVRDRDDGVLWIGTTAPIAPRLVNLLVSLADMLSSSLERAELYEASWRYADELEQRVQDRTQELAAANEQLRELDKLKSKFVSNVSHELRTPISSLKLYLNLLERGNEKKRNQYQSMLRQSADRLGQLVQDILSLSRLEMARLQPQEFGPTDLNAVVSQVVQHLQPQADAAGLQLHFNPAADLPLISGDYNQLSQLVSNLLSNALTYTEQGHVCVWTHLESNRAEQLVEEADVSHPPSAQVTLPCIHLMVKDTGIGIHPDDLPHILERFYRGNHVVDQDIPGTGLGLAIVKEIVHIHQGQIDLTSEVGAGTRIDIRLPLVSAGDMAVGD